jgi:hypothetical protein
MASGFKQATVNASDVPSTQTDFPAYVDLSRLGITTLAEAQSVRVYADSGKVTEWAREIVSATEMHVKVPSLTSTTTIYIDYDGVRADYAVTDTYGRNAVWSDYRGVWHFESLTADSTSNSYSLTNFNSVGQTTGQLNGQAADFGSGNTNKYLSISNNLGITGGNITMSCWFSQIGVRALNTQGVYLHQGDEGTDVEYYIMAQNSAGTPQMVLFRVKQFVSNDEVRFNYEPGNQGWQFWTISYDGTNVRGYQNGVLQGTRASSGNGVSAGVTGFRAGANLNAVSNLASGSIDEARVSNLVRSGDWITTEHNNQSDEAGFWGTWTDVGGGNRRIIIV